jgi:hypothetical protein
VSTRFEQRLDDGNLRNYGRLVIELASTVPDGLVVFFVSYSYMDYVIARWHEDGLLAELINHKLIFIETQVCGRVVSRTWSQVVGVRVCVGWFGVWVDVRMCVCVCVRCLGYWWQA